MIIDHRFDHIADDEARRRAWIDSLSSFFVTHINPDAVVPASAFHRYHHMNHLVFGEIEASPQTIERTPALVAAQNIDHVVLRLYTSGRTNISTGGDTSEITQESFVLFDLSQPILSETKGMTGLNLAVPRRLIEGGGDLSSWHGQILPSARSPITKLLADLFRNVSASLRTATTAQMNHIVPATTALCNALFLSETDSAYNRPAVTGIAIRQFIDENLTKVDVGMLRVRFGMSRSPLYKLFEAEGGVYAYIRDRRLSHAMQMFLRAPGSRRPTIAQLAFSAGFENERVFSRAFKRKYGVNPKDIDGTAAAALSQQQTSQLLSWVKNL
ncbi:AraC family transcriptional regulator [Methylobacterium sp. E-045]|uniref:AraC family transcriptional regulator n=1 Tax=Methylobacterium sp. E-045 TaxID=2836575 RepID=UPI001FBB1051|nr:AraC family transcriptional regulator [Methylobacterium sp. E-045]MCJ2128189.1 AraC family transcriptional regulator [Methylobacterium sp. E-045]